MAKGKSGEHGRNDKVAGGTDDCGDKQQNAGESSPSPSQNAWQMETWRFILFGKVVPLLVFGYFAVLQAENAVGLTVEALRRPTAGILVSLFIAVLYAAFSIAPVFIYLVHARPRAKDERPLIRMIAIVDTFVLIFLGAVVPRGIPFFQPSIALKLAAASGILVASVVQLWALLILRSGFSLTPEARTVATSGPYRIIRHPLYFSEALFEICLLLSNPILLLVICEALVIILAVVRIRAEEQLLSTTFPAYKAFMKRTRYRLIPFVW